MVCYTGGGFTRMDERLLRAEAVVFDVGNVLLSFAPDQVSRLLPQEHRERLARAMFGPMGRWGEFDLGIRSNGEIARDIAKEADVPGGEEMVLYALLHFHETMRPLPLYHLISPLRRMGKRLYALTNYPEPSFTLTQEAFPELKELDGQLVSAREKVGKPSQAFFRLLIDRYSLHPETALFIDDLEANILAGAKAGFQTWHYAGDDRIK